MKTKIQCQCDIHESISKEESKKGLIIGLIIVVLFLLASVLDTQYINAIQ